MARAGHDLQQLKADRPLRAPSSGEDDPKLSSACRAAFRLLPGVAGTHVELVYLTPHQTKRVFAADQRLQSDL